LDLPTIRSALTDIAIALDQWARLLDIPVDVIWQRNISKLRQRFGDHFEASKALTRDLAAELQATAATPLPNVFRTNPDDDLHDQALLIEDINAASI
jgi:hypothetical protein